MIKIHRNGSSALTGEPRIKIIGLGGAGSNALDRIVLDGPTGGELVAMNTDMQALTGSVAEEKVQLGLVTTRGLGAGGDPEVGYTAAEESADEIREVIKGAKIVILCVGLGGGTGSGGARIVAALGREQGAFVVAVATMPFTFEGRRRTAQAEEALSSLQRNADLVICFENDRMGDGVSPLAGIQEAFRAADQTINQCVRGLTNMARQRGLIHLGFDDLATALRVSGGAAPQCLFGYGEAEGDNRANEALAHALKCPLMDKGQMLEDTHNVLISVAGGPDMTLNEVQILMEEFNRLINDHTRLLFGTTVDPRLGQKISVMVITALNGVASGIVAALPARTQSRVETSPVSVASSPVAPAAHRAIEATHVPEERHVVEEHSPRISYVDTDAAVSPPAPELAPAPVAASVALQNGTAHHGTAHNGTPTPSPSQAPGKPLGKSKALAKQEQMQFEPVTRGRFEKSEPTIVDGQDLDVPTFLRRNVKVK